MPTKNTNTTSTILITDFFIITIFESTKDKNIKLILILNEVKTTSYSQNLYPTPLTE